MSKAGTVMIACALVLGCGCGEKEKPAVPSEPAPGPPLSPLELPVSLRTSDSAPNDARKVEITQSEVRVDDKVVLKLDAGRAAPADQSNGTLPKLVAALQTPARGSIALLAHAMLPYETATLALNSASAAGVHGVSFRVRKSGGSTELGWLTLASFQTTPRSDDEVAITGIAPRKWDEFADAWQAMHDACRASQTGSCPYVESNVAKGGDLRMELFAASAGVNLNFYRVGLTPADLAAEEQRRKAALAAHKEDYVQGRGKKSDIEKKLEEEESVPATQALFQFRAREATDPPSVISNVMQSLCGTKACGVVATADGNTPFARVVGLIGAAFTDGSTAPAVAFELPWTPKPKAPPPPPPPAAEPEPEPPAKGKHAKAGAHAKGISHAPHMHR